MVNFWTGKITKFSDESVLLITEAVAKREVQKDGDYVRKSIALPCSPIYEPWTEDLLRWIKNHGTLSFSLTRTRVLQIVKRHLRELDPKVHTHSLRHWRISHLASEYGFDPYDLCSYGGWSLKFGFGMVGIPINPMLSVYTHLSWQKYFPKLLKPLHD